MKKIIPYYMLIVLLVSAYTIAFTDLYFEPEDTTLKYVFGAAMCVTGIVAFFVLKKAFNPDKTK